MEQRQMVGPYQILGDLGSGTTSKVKLAVHTETNERVAIKVIRKDSFKSGRSLEKIYREVALMRIIDHCNILKIVDFLESPRHIMVVIEYASNGELFDFLIERKTLPLSIAARFFRQIVYAVEYIHSLGICHRDLKPENILLDENFNIKLADFGFARFVRDMTQTSCGSPHYAAPEIIKGHAYDGKAADTWSCGIILFALLAGYLPFDDSSIRALLMKVKKGEYVMAPNIPPVAADLIQHILVVDPAQRITISQIKRHPFFRIDLPDDYVCPRPIPMTEISDPVDPATISPEITEIMGKIGYNTEEELVADLISSECTMAKRFLVMLTQRSSLEQLDWANGDQLSQSVIMMQPLQESFAVNNSMDPFHRTLNEPTSSMSFVHSHASQLDWAVTEDDTDAFVKSASFHCVGLTVVDLARMVQIIANEGEWQWFHPDENTIIARKEQNGTYVCMRILSTGSEELDAYLGVNMYRGIERDFDELCVVISERLAGNMR